MKFRRIALVREIDQPIYTLTKIDLKEHVCQLDEGAVGIARALESNLTLTKLDLNGRRHSADEVATAFGRALESNSTLTRLVFEVNNVGDEGATAIARALESNSTLTQLFLEQNSVKIKVPPRLREHWNPL